MPLEYDAQYDEHDNRCHEHATAQPRKRLILSLGVFEDLTIWLMVPCFFCFFFSALSAIDFLA